MQTALGGTLQQTARKGRLLLVDDEPIVLRGCRRMLESAGYTVDAAGDGEAAMALMKQHEFDAIISDIGMPGLSGLQLLSRIRAHDLEVPVILMTGDPAVETAQQAVEYGALRYLVKPIEMDTLIKGVEQAVRMHKLALLRRQALELMGDPMRVVTDRAGLEASYARGIEKMWMAYQPIVSWREKRMVAVEGLLRTREPSIPHPGAFLDAAERLKRLPDLGRNIRRHVASDMRNAPEGIDLFVNLHPQDLLDDTLFADDAPLTAIARRVVLEITERSALEHVRDVGERVQKLRALGFRIALDDLGAGYAGLSSFAQLEPEVVKLDMSFVRNIHNEPVKQRLVASLVPMCVELGIKVIAEGIETVDERDAIVGLGVDLLQGYLFSKPVPPFPLVKFE